MSFFAARDRKYRFPCARQADLQLSLDIRWHGNASATFA